jgi:hypothetical protein
MSEGEIRIESKTGPKGGNFIQATDADTGKQCSNIESIVIRVARNDVVIADIYYDDGAVSRRHVGEIAVTVLTDALPVRGEVSNGNSTN